MEGTKLSFNNYFGAIPLLAFGAVFMVVGASIFFGIPPISSQPSVFGLVFFLGGVLMAFLYTLRSVSADKSSAKLSYSYRSVLSGGTFELEFSKISTVKFTKVWVRQNKGGKWVAHTTIKQSDGNELDVQEAIGNQEDAKKLADLIGVPFSYETPPSLMNALGAVGSAISSGMQKYQTEMEKPPQNPSP